MRLLMLQYSGDYREAVQRLARGGSENYYAQKYSVDAVAELTKYFEDVAVLCCQTDESYNEVLINGVRGIGAGFCGAVDEDVIIQLIEQQQPTHLVVITPLRKVLRWAIKRRIKILVQLAESIVVKSWRDRWRAFQLMQLLNHPQVDWVGSYGITSSKHLKAIGVNPDKIIPWDFLISPTPGSYSPKTLPSTAASWNLIYVGSISEAKGVGDILRAVAILRERRFPIRLSIVGNDSEGTFAKLATDLNIANAVDFLGMLPNNEIEPRMREADVVLVPSRHEYTEGFPLTIHHALCSRTPIIASDHPMFREHLKHEVNAVMFPAGNAAVLATRIEALLNDPKLYAALSQASHDTWYQMRLPVKCNDLINCWIVPSIENRQWLFEQRLSAFPHSQQHPGELPIPSAIPQFSDRILPMTSDIANRHYR